MSSTGKKRKKCQDNGPWRIENDPGASTYDSCDDAGPSQEFREPRLEPKHKIFVSHSGAQKDFTEQLCVDLERVHHFPFFDRRDNCLRKGEKFPPVIIDAAQQCCVAVLVLSDEFFTRSKWPMIELKEFVTAQRSSNPGLRILPLFLGLTMEQFHEEERRARWLTTWNGFAGEDGRVDVEAWKVALSKIPGGINAMEYSGACEGEVAFRKKVVEAICKLLPPDVKYDVSHVQSLERLCEPIKKKLEEVGGCARFKVGVVGLYGMGGTGKTTITRAICNEMFAEFSGKVCHIEMKEKNEIESLRRVLEELTEASATILNKSSSELVYLLKKRMRRQKVFLVLDNVWDNHIQIQEVENYLYADYHDGSKVLVTTRSLDVLKHLHIEECNCMEMPILEEEGAIGVFLHSTRISKELIEGIRDLKIVRQCINECRFSCGGEPTYHPLALKALGGQLGSLSLDTRMWDVSMKKLKDVKFNMLKDKVHPVFSVLRVGFDALGKEHQRIFLDVALLWASKRNVRFPTWEWEWLATLHSMSEDEMIASVEALERNGLLEKVKKTYDMKCSIHDLYLEFAEVEARSQPFEERWVLLDKDGTHVPPNLRMHPWNGVSWPSLKRLIFRNSNVKSLKREDLHHCKNVEVLVLDGCELLEEVDVTGMSNLRFLMVRWCSKLGKCIGLEMLQNLVIFCWSMGGISRSPRAVDLVFSSTILQVVKLTEFVVENFAHMNIHQLGLRDSSTCYQPVKINVFWVPFLDISSPMFANLQDLNLHECKGIGDLTDFCKLFLLEKLNVSRTAIKEVPHNLCKLKLLQSIDVSHCGNLESIQGIVGASSLQRVIARGCYHLKKVPEDLGKLQKLEVLDVSSCFQLQSLGGIAYATALQHVLARYCRCLSKVPEDFCRLENLVELDLRGSKLIHTLPNDYKRLAGSNSRMEGGIAKVEECWGLIVPLVKKLERSQVSWAACVDNCNGGGESIIQSWVEDLKNVDDAAYNLLKAVLLPCGDFSVSGCWTYMIEDRSEVVDVLICGLCEHNFHSQTSTTTNRLRDVVVEVTSDYGMCLEEWAYPQRWWIVVATAPSTFKVVTKRAILEPWRKTLLHYTIVSILPCFLRWRDYMVINGLPRFLYPEYSSDGDEEDINEDNGDFFLTWSYKAIEAVLKECIDKFKDVDEEDMDKKRNQARMDIVYYFWEEIIEAKNEVTLNHDVLQSSMEGNWLPQDELYTDDQRYYDLFRHFSFFSRFLKMKFASLGRDEICVEEGDSDEEGTEDEGSAEDEGGYKNE